MKNLLSIFILFPSFVFADIHLKCITAGHEDAVRYVKINIDNKEIEVWDYLYKRFSSQRNIMFEYYYYKYVDLEITKERYTAVNKFFTDAKGQNWSYKDKKTFVVDRINRDTWHRADPRDRSSVAFDCKNMNSIFFTFKVNALKNQAEKENGPKF